MPHQDSALHVLEDRNCKNATKIAREQETGNANQGCWNSFTGQQSPLSNRTKRYHRGRVLVGCKFRPSSIPAGYNSVKFLCGYLPPVLELATETLRIRLRSFMMIREVSPYKPEHGPLPWVIGKRRSTSSPEFYKAADTSVKNRGALKLQTQGGGELLTLRTILLTCIRDLGDQVRIMNTSITCKVTLTFSVRCAPTLQTLAKLA
jgi:hypothetical protein